VQETELQHVCLRPSWWCSRRSRWSSW